MLTQRLNTPASGISSEAERLWARVLFPFGDLPLDGRYGHEELPVNIWEDAESLQVEAEVPGVQMEELEILVNRDVLTIRGKCQEPAEGSISRWHRRERLTPEFSRVLALGAEVESREVEACLKDGVLNITLPKAREYCPRKIAVQQVD